MSHVRPASRLCATVSSTSRSFVITLTACVAACGGGGGSGGSGAGGGAGAPFTISLDRTALTWTYYEGNAPSKLIVNSTSTGTYDGDLFARIVIENNGAVNAIQPQIPISVTGTLATAEVTPALGLTAGVYTGRLVFSACSDQACINRIGGTPLNVSFTVNVLTPVRAAPSAISRSSVSGTGIVEDVVVVPGANETGFSIEPILSSIVIVSDQTPGGFRVTLPSLPVGVYAASIPLTGSNGSRATLPISYTVTAPPGGQQPLAVSPVTLTFATSEGATPPAQSLQVTEATWRPGLLPPIVEYQGGQDWLDVADVVGGYSVTATAASIPAGTYAATIFVRNAGVPPGVVDPFPTQQHRPVSVSLTVGHGFIRPADVSHVFDSETTPAELGGSVSIDVAGGIAVTWVAESNLPWLVVDTPTGASGAELEYSIDGAWLATAANFVRQEATITVSAPGTVLTPMSFAIAVEPQLAEVSGVGPHVVLAGQPTTLVVAGRGFGAVADIASRLAITPALSPSSIERSSDRKLLLHFDSLNAATYEVSIDNVLGIATGHGTVIGKFGVPYVYATAATERLDALVVDHERDVLYGVRRNGYDGSGASLADGRLYRFSPGGPSQWTGEEVALEAVDNVGVLFGGDLAVATSPGTLRVLDGVTLAEKSSVNLACIGRSDRSQSGLPVTLDGRVWLSVSTINSGCAGTPRFGELGAFDPDTTSPTFEPFPIPTNTTPPLPSRFPNGPDFAVVRTGERLVLQTGSSAPFALVAELDIASATLAPIPQGGWGRVSVSDDGRRLLLEAALVTDGQFMPIGELVIPDYQSPISVAARAAAVMAPDGKRAYVLTYRSSDLIPGVPPPTTNPRVYVFDTSGSGDPPLLGYFEIDDYPSCTDVASGCDARAVGAISLDGNTLFLAGDTLFVVVPIPSTLEQP